MMQWIAAGDGINMNYRWSQTRRTNRNRQDLLYLEGLFPFANVPTFDPISDTSDCATRNAKQTNTCPLAMEFYSANEYWVKAGSLMTPIRLDTVDLPDHPTHATVSTVEQATRRRGQSGVQGHLPAVSQPARLGTGATGAVGIDLDEWSTQGHRVRRLAGPEASRRHPGAAAAASAVGFPNIPGVTYTGLKTTRYRFNYGPNFYQTFVPTINPPVITPPYEDNPANGPIYPSYVPKTDSDGNDIAGIRLPELVVPLATYTGWALRSGVWANDGCEASGQYIPFAADNGRRAWLRAIRVAQSRSAILRTGCIALK